MIVDVIHKKISNVSYYNYSRSMVEFSSQLDKSDVTRTVIDEDVSILCRS
jgi:hypothetical protein